MCRGARSDRRIDTIRHMNELDRHTSARNDDRRVRLNQRLRREFVEGAEEDSRQRLGRGLTVEELERVLRRYPGDIPESLETVVPESPRPIDEG